MDKFYFLKSTEVPVKPGMVFNIAHQRRSSTADALCIVWSTGHCTEVHFFVCAEQDRRAPTNLFSNLSVLFGSFNGMLGGGGGGTHQSLESAVRTIWAFVYSMFDKQCIHGPRFRLSVCCFCSCSYRCTAVTSLVSCMNSEFIREQH